MNERLLIARLPDAIEAEIAPKTADGVASGNEPFGAAILCNKLSAGGGIPLA